MSTITTTPAPQLSRTPLLIGIAVVGVLAVSAVVVPRIASTDGSATSTGTPAQETLVSKHDLIEHTNRPRQSLDNARVSSALERQMTHAGKVLASTSGRVTPAAVVPRSTFASQVGGLRPTYAYRPATVAAVGLVPAYGYNGRELVQLTPAIAPSTYTRWTDTFVPPFRDPAWRDAIERHYAGSFTTSTAEEIS